MNADLQILMDSHGMPDGDMIRLTRLDADCNWERPGRLLSGALIEASDRFKLRSYPIT